MYLDYWGPPQHTVEIAEGVILVSTASHGGIVLSPERFASLPEDHQRLAVKRGAGPDNAYFEEDSDWCIPVLGLPDLDWSKGLPKNYRALACRAWAWLHGLPPLPVWMLEE